MAIGAELNLSKATEKIGSVYESDPESAFLLICDSGTPSSIAKRVAEELSLEPSEQFEIDVSEFVNETKIQFQLTLGGIIRSRPKGLLLVKGIENANRDIALMVGTILGDRHISDQSVVAEKLPDTWIFLVSGAIDSIDPNRYIKNTWFLDRFFIIRVVS